MKHLQITFAAALSLLAVPLTTNAAPVATPESSPFSETAQQHDARMAWWKDARFGMFIHWGLYSQAGGYWNGKPASGAEWLQIINKIPNSQYSKLVQQFDPEQFDAKKWVQIAKDAGMKYLVITTKHHEGFCIWPTNTTDFSLTSTPWWKKDHIDPLKELKDACDQAGIKFCIYYSIWDLNQKDFAPRQPYYDINKDHQPDMKKYVEFMKVQLDELITRYHPGLVWFDGGLAGAIKAWNNNYGHEIESYLRAKYPTLILNNRLAPKGKLNTDFGDYLTPEQAIPDSTLAKPFEVCMTINDTWGYAKQATHFKSAQTLIRNLIDITSKGGNFLLNVGPTGAGVIPQPEVERLAEVGKWLKVNGEAIYGTNAGPFKTELPWGRATQKGNTLYLEVFDWPKDGKLVVPIKNNIGKAALLTANGEVWLTINFDANGLMINVPQTAPDAIASVIALTLSDKPQPIVH